MTTETAGPCKTPIHFDGRTFVCGGKHATADHAKVVADEIAARLPSPSEKPISQPQTGGADK